MKRADELTRKRWHALLVIFALLIGMGFSPQSAQAAEVVNARDFGVTPGVTSSQTEALHAAMRYFYDRGQAGTVYLPAGTYYFDEAIRFHANVNLVGDGMGQTVLKKMGNSVNYVVGNPILPSNSNHLNVTISDLTFDADRTNRAQQGMVQVGGMNIDADVRYLTLNRVEVRDATIGLLLRRLKDSAIRNSRIDLTSGHAIAFGSESHPVGDVRNNVITNNIITNSTGGSGINLSRATYTTVTDNQIINNQQQDDTYGGIRIPNGGEHNLVHNNTIVNYPRGIFVLTGAVNNVITDNVVRDSRIHGILIQADNNTFSGNLIQQLDPQLNPEALIRLAPGSQNTIRYNYLQSRSNFNNIGIRVTGESSNNSIRDNMIETNGALVSLEGGSNNTNVNNSHFFSENASFQLKSRHSGKLLEVGNASTENGANVNQWENTNCSCQRWTLTRDNSGYFGVINVNSGKALDVYNGATSDGANVVQWDYHGGAMQQWQLKPNSSGYFTLINRNSGKALDVEGKSTANGGNIVQWTFNGGANQQWEITR
ncbi:parallel beta-helix repeat (two copies) [Evansella caseinilytica]|uniref:Parallel beta-helix repeat (Two copies) n=1 Tax=Evansella caseinilytica TaxID=1503961 RepID=A0A1H3QRR9_9BACI|nr:RICIN domain-containing protein [Evansella caseinilytica]SDZ16106.1 parallel beta-helix repeat (two copies) [Evansella caseinilytica]